MSLMDKDYHFLKDKLAGIAYPYAVLDADALQYNIALTLKRAGSKNIRIASKSIRCRQVMEILLNSHSAIQGIMTYHGQELISLAQIGFDNLLMGYPVVEPGILRQIAALIASGKKICLMVDHPVHLHLLNKVGHEANIKMPICIDLDLSMNLPGLRFGVWRSQLSDIKDLGQFLELIKQLPNLSLEGLMGYEAQIAGVPDKMPGQGIKNGLIRWLKNRSSKSIIKRRQQAVDMIHDFGIHLKFVNGGGTGSVEYTVQEDCVTEITVGSGFFAPHLFDHFTHFQLQPALLYAIPITRNPQEKVFTCHGGGFIASGAIDTSKQPVIHLPKGGKLEPLEGAGEVQTPIRFREKPADLNIGDPVFLRHAKAGELCEHFNDINFISQKDLVRFPTYRGDGWAFG